MDELQRLQAWYAAHCDGDWEHQFGVSIDTLDNPGWTASIDLQETELSGKSFDEVKDNFEHETEWMRCWVEDGQFHIACGPTRLREALKLFLDWSAAV
jgi:hypothetical protein